MSYRWPLRLSRNGASYQDVADEFSVKPDTIYRLAKRRNVAKDGKCKAAPMVGFRSNETEMKALYALVATHGRIWSAA